MVIDVVGFGVLLGNGAEMGRLLRITDGLVG